MRNFLWRSWCKLSRKCLNNTFLIRISNWFTQTTQETVMSLSISFVMSIPPHSFPHLINSCDEEYLNNKNHGKSQDYCNLLSSKTRKIEFLRRGVLRDEFLHIWELSGWQSKHFWICHMVLNSFLAFLCSQNQENQIFGANSSSGWVLTHVRTFKI